MVTIDHVICPVDLSRASANALRHAHAWARSYEAPLRVLHVAPLPQTVVSGTGQMVVLPTRPLEAIREDVERFVRETTSRQSRVFVWCEATPSSPGIRGFGSVQNAVQVHGATETP